MMGENEADASSTYTCSRCGQGDVGLSNQLEEKVNQGGELVCGPDIGSFEFGADHFAYCSNCGYAGDPKTQTSWFKRILIYVFTAGFALAIDILFILTGRYQFGQQPVCQKCGFENIENWYVA